MPYTACMLILFYGSVKGRNMHSTEFKMFEGIDRLTLIWAEGQIRFAFSGTILHAFFVPAKRPGKFSLPFLWHNSLCLFVAQFSLPFCGTLRQRVRTKRRRNSTETPRTQTDRNVKIVWIENHRLRSYEWETPQKQRKPLLRCGPKIQFLINAWMLFGIILC